MSTHQSFLDAIKAQPADRSVRLVYADWLEERGDLGGELIRIEEEMRRLPVWADRFWELKPRRNQLRERVDSSWRKRLGYGLDVPPTFAHGIPDGWRERWRLIREFTERWHRIPMPDVGGRYDYVNSIEQQFRRMLPPSVQEWVAFVLDVREDPAFSSEFAIEFQLQDLPERSAISLANVGENQLGVRYSDLATLDPPMQRLPRDFDDRARVLTVRGATANVSAFALQFTTQRMIHNHLRFDNEVLVTKRFLGVLQEVFPVQIQLPHVTIMERENLFAKLSDSFGDFSFTVVPAHSRDAVPPVLWEFLDDGFLQNFSDDPPF